jgi:hypothetical protein
MRAARTAKLSHELGLLVADWDDAVVTRGIAFA